MTTKCAFFIALTAIALVSGAGAGGYTDFAEGIGANNRGESDLAVASFSRAISAGDLAPNLLPTAYYGRSVAYLRRGLPRSAIDDLTAAVRLNPQSADAYDLLGFAHSSTGDFDAAIQDYSEFIRLQPGAGHGYAARARARWGAKDFQGAAADAEEAIALGAHGAYDVLWVAIARERIGKPDPQRLKQETRQLDLEKWPGPLLKLYLGTSTPDEVRNMVQLASDPAVKKAETCQAEFYIGEWLHQRGDVAALSSGYQQAAKDCPNEFSAPYKR